MDDKLHVGHASTTGQTCDGISRSFLLIPAVQAAWIQVLSFALMLALAYVLMWAWNVQLDAFLASVLQGGFAAAITWKRRLAFWWIFIQSIFPLALIATLSLQISPSIFLGFFAVLLGMYWSTFRTQVPFYPSSPATWNAVLAELPVGKAIRLVDVGSGLGGLVLRLAEQRPESHFIGIELAPVPWLISVLRKYVRRNAAQFVRGDYGKLDFSTQDVVFAYLSPAAMPALWQKAHAEMRKGALLLSFEFAIPGVEPHFVRYPTPDGPALYGWRM